MTHFTKVRRQAPLILALLGVGMVVTGILFLAFGKPDRLWKGEWLILMGAVGGIPALLEISDRVHKTITSYTETLITIDEIRELKESLTEAVADFKEEVSKMENLQKDVEANLKTLGGVAYNATSDAQSAKNEATIAREVAARAESNLIIGLVERLTALEIQNQRNKDN